MGHEIELNCYLKIKFWILTIVTPVTDTFQLGLQLMGCPGKCQRDPHRVGQSDSLSHTG